MATSGTFSFNPSLGNLALSAYSRIRIRRPALLAEHMTAMRASWQNQPDYGKIPIVYKATNLVNGKRYIGVTGMGLKYRVRSHFTLARRGDRGVFMSAIRKYGPDKFKFSILVECANYQEALVREMEFIADLKPEYNITWGGQGMLGASMSEEAKAKISKANKGRKFPDRKITEEHRAKLTAGLRSRPHHRPWLGRKHSEESKQKVSESKRAQMRVHTASERAAARLNIKKAQASRNKAVRCLLDGREFASGPKSDDYYGLIHGASWRIANGTRKPTKSGLDFEFVEKSK